MLPFLLCCGGIIVAKLIRLAGIFASTRRSLLLAALGKKNCQKETSGRRKAVDGRSEKQAKNGRRTEHDIFPTTES